MQLSGIKKKKPFLGLLLMEVGGFTSCIVYFVNYYRNDLLIVYLKSLDLPSKKKLGYLGDEN